MMQYILALVAGIITVFAFSPFSIPYLAILGLMLLFYTWANATPKYAFYQGFVFGLGFFGLGVSWVYESLQGFGEAIAPIALLMTFLFIAFLALFPALVGFLSKVIKLSKTLTLIIAFPAFWILVEWLRSWFLTGFPWLNIGNSQLDTPIAAVIPILGGLGASFITALIASLVVILFQQHKVWKKLLSLSVVIIIFLALFLLQDISWTKPKDNSLEVALIQGNISQQEYWQDNHLDFSLERYNSLSKAQWDKDIIIWPETAISDFIHPVCYQVIAPLQEQVKQHDNAIIFGIFDYDLQDVQYYNAMMVLDKNTEVSCHAYLNVFNDKITIANNMEEQLYRKHHLVPFGEYLPFRDVFKFLENYIQVPMADLSPGNKNQKPLIIAGEPVHLSICYEAAFSNEFLPDLPEASILINVSNDAWFGDSFAPHQHLEIARMRALESGRYLLRATNSGISAVINPKGKVLQQTEQFKQAVLTAKIYPYQGATPYIRWGDNFIVILSTFSLIYSILFTIFSKLYARTVSTRNHRT